MARNLSLEVAYQMYHGVHIQTRYDGNYTERTARSIRSSDRFIPRLTQIWYRGNLLFHRKLDLSRRYCIREPAIQEPDVPGELYLQPND